MAETKRPRRRVTRDAPVAAAANSGAGYQLRKLESLVGFGVRSMHQYLASGMASVVEAEGLKPHQFTALSLIVDNPGISQRDVAQALTIKPSNMVPLIDELELRGLVQRNPAATNRRTYALTSTPEGERLRGQALTRISSHEDNLLHFLTGEERAFLAGLTKRLSVLPR